MEHAFVIESGTEITPDSLPLSILNSAETKGITKGAIMSTGGIQLSRLDEDEEDGHEVIDINLPENQQAIGNALTSGFRVEFTKLDFEANKEEFEKVFLMNALKTFNGKINQTALHANIPKKTLLRKLEKYGIIAKEFKQ
jgi:DNA-binding NtrC family response regulator